MLHKIDAMLLHARFAVKGFVEDLKNDERGLSGVVVAVLLILIAVLAIVMLWGSLKSLLSDLWGKVTGGSGGGGANSITGSNSLTG